jgi:glycosyltransferase involved in cell wall biosynthesis
MSTKEHPFVSVVTPVFNGEKYLRECIESVLSQTYSRYEYLIQNNFSTDRTLEIAEEYAKKDARIKVFQTDRLLPIIENWNSALSKISPKSKYCKVLHADDLLYPECLEKMIEVAEISSKIGIVGSYALLHSRVKFDGLPKDQIIIDGKQLCSSTLKRKIFLFGSPSNIMYRAEIIKMREEFYNKKFLHADTEICYDILRDFDFGFVHQVLSYTRFHDESQTESVSNKYNTNLMEYLAMLDKYGSIYLTRTEYASLKKRRTKKFYLFLANNIFQFFNKSYREYILNSTKRLGIRFSNFKLIYYFFLLIVDKMLNPKETIGMFLRRTNKKE